MKTPLFILTILLAVGMNVLPTNVRAGGTETTAAKETKTAPATEPELPFPIEQPCQRPLELKTVNGEALPLELSAETFADFSEKTAKNYSRSAEAVNLNEVKRTLKYPAFARENRLHGTVTVAVNVNAEGKMTRHTLIAADHPALAQEVAAKLGALVFKPAVRNGQTAPDVVKLTFAFVAQ